MASISLKSTDKLNTGGQIPLLGFGVWDSPKDLTEKSCLEALKVGYRHIDTAQLYGNEKEVGEAVRKSGLLRSNIFITSKIYTPESQQQDHHTHDHHKHEHHDHQHQHNQDAESVYRKCLDSVHKIAGEDGYLDLMLIHNANVGPEKVKLMWQAMERLKAEGKFKAIGASNFGIGHIKRLKEYAKVWPPAVNQLELHPWHQQTEVVKYCEEQGIVLEAYCPLVRNQKAEDPDLVAIAKKHSKSTAQVLIRYSLQKQWVPLPKSDNPARIAQNADVYDFELDAEDMKKLDGKEEHGKGALVLAVSNE